jgi:S-adenosylmethionine:tRNA ribosyltransferase-isomerase
LHFEFRDNITQSISTNEALQYISNLELQDFWISCSTKIFLYPWKEFRIIDQLLTNLHLPKSSLLMLVAAFIGYKNMMAIYHHAIQENYRFFSFWDCMLLRKSE